MNEDLEKFISYMPTYGVRVIGEIYEHPEIMEGNLVIGYNQKMLFDKEHMLSLVRKMSDDGFTIIRHDISVGDKLYFELTERGRKLKELRTIEMFNLYEADEGNQKSKALRREANGYRISVGILLATLAAAVYYILEIIKHHLGNFDLTVLTSLIVFLFGIIAGIIIYILISGGSTQKNK